MKFYEYLMQQLNAHPVMEPQDMVKLCYQAAFGAEHLLTDIGQARAYFESEYERVPGEDTVLWEQISPDVCRVNLRSWKYMGLPGEWLFGMFAASFGVSEKGRELFTEYLDAVRQTAEQGKTGFSPEEWDAFLMEYRKAGMPAVHHSQKYRDSEHPAYRIVSSRFIRVLPVLQRAADLAGDAADGKPKVILLEGRAAAGKSTMAELLKAALEADVVHMDDFFVPPELRSEERFAHPGGNVHYERFAEEVLPYAGEAAPFSYRIFDCGRMEYHGRREMGVSSWRVVEGAYCTHPAFGAYGDLKVFLDIEPEEQMRRITERNGEKMARMFAKRWIPLEEAYFAAYGVQEKMDLVLKSRG